MAIVRSERVTARARAWPRASLQLLLAVSPHMNRVPQTHMYVEALNLQCDYIWRWAFTKLRLNEVIGVGS